MSAFADDAPVAPPPAEMDTVTVTGQPEDLLTGSNTLRRETLDHLPMRNGSPNELLTILPGIQSGEFSRTSDNAGEILPPSISISGGRFYDNNFMIDGMGSNSLLDPAFDNPANIENVPGHPQELFINPAFIDRLSVYRFNVPARYGSFTGGVVDIGTRDPAERFGGEIYVRHTRDQWTELHYDEDRRDAFDNPTSGSVQPKFDKYDSGASLDIPLNSQSSLLAGYSQVRSDIPLVLIDQPKDQSRLLENYFLKYINRLTPSSTVRLTGTATPYEAEYFLKDTLHSDYTVKNGGYGLVGSLEQLFNWGTAEVTVGYRHSENTREAPSDYFIWQAKNKDGSPTSKPWGLSVGSNVSNEGGYGDVEKDQSTWSAALDLTSRPILTGQLQHLPAGGLHYEDSSASFDRNQELFRYTGSTANNTVTCAPGAIDCVDYEQFFFARNVYPEDHAEAVIRFYDAYVEDTLTWGRLTVRPGMRFSYDDLQKNQNWGHRLAAGFDLFGNGRTVLIGGLNRYYANTLLTHALAEKKLPYRNERTTNDPLTDKSYTALNGTTPKPWQDIGRTSINATRLASLETPYSDEWVVGLQQGFFDGVINLDYLERDTENELASTTVKDGSYTYTEWTNDGSSSHREATLSWERSWQNHYLLVTATWQETETAYSNYLQRVDSPDLNADGILDPVWYRGKLYDRNDLPRPDFNREWSAALTYSGRMPWGFTFTNIARYRSGYTALSDTGETYVLDSGEKLDVYDEVKQPESWIFDWKLDWEKQLIEGQALIVSLEVNNVFDERVNSGETIDVYDLGRQFWLGLTYKF
jgi:hypothetical protein